MIAGLTQRFLALDADRRRHVSGVVLCMALYCFHALWFSTWLIEDAAISYAFAENFANGEGFVAYPGGEPVEGFSNPTWTLLLALSAFLGGSPWVMGKVFGVSFGLAAIPLAYVWARRTAPDDLGNWVLIAPFMAAVSTQHVLWAASGLENGLFNLLLTAGAVRILMEADRPRWGVSGLLLGLLAITRPEAPLYAAVIALVGGIGALRAGGLRWAGSFALAGLGPFATWHAWRYWTFAWEFPNTYYAKQTEEKFKPFAWNRRGWAYVRNWALVSVHGFVWPLFTLGQSGVRGWLGFAGLALTGIVLGLTTTGVGWIRTYGPFDLPPEPEIVTQIRVVALVGAAVAFPLLGLFRSHVTPRLMAWGLVLCALFFAVFTGGDWMRMFRWLSMAAIPLAVLLADAARELGHAVHPLFDWVARRVPYFGKRRKGPVQHGTVALWLALPLLLGGVGQSIGFIFGLETTPFDVRRRVLYMQGVQDRLHLDHASLLEVDMGAHMMWSGFELTDMAGLVNVPVARHHYAPEFIDAYVRDERNPTFAHVHGGWARKTGINRRPWFNQTYLEIPGYGHSPWKFHVGNHIRKDLLIAEDWHGEPGRRVDFGGAVLEGLELPAPVAYPGGTLYVELGWSIRARPPGFRALLFLSDGERLVVKELPPAYDWMPIPRWRRNQVYVGRHTLTLPDDLPVGTWDVGLALVPDDVLTGPFVGQPVDGSGARVSERVPAVPHFAAGEARFPGMLRVAPVDEVEAAAEAGLAATRRQAAEDRCQDAETQWSTTRRFFPRDHAWHATHDADTHASLAVCWAHRAAQTGAVEDIRRARRWDHHPAEVRRVSHELADRFEAEGDVARDAGDVSSALARWTDALAADPSRAWVRRRLEKLRATLYEEAPQ